MNNNLPLSFLMVMILLLCGCVKKQPHPGDVMIVDLSGIWDHPKELSLSSIATDIEYISLETTPECLLGEPQKLHATVLENHIAISSNGLRLFDRHGKYLRLIGSIGKGPREYLSSGKYVVDEKKGRVDILDDQQDRVVSFRLTGEFIGSFMIGKRAESEILRDPAGGLGLFYLTPTEDEDNPTRLEWVTDQGKLMESIPVYTGRPKGGGAFWAIASNLFWAGNELLFNENPFDTVYHLDRNRLWEPYRIVEVGPKKMPVEVSLDIQRFSAELDSYNVAKLALETSRYIIFATNSAKGSGAAIFDKSDGKAVLMVDKTEETSGTLVLDNDLDGGPPLAIQLMSPDALRGNEIISVLSPFDILVQFKNKPESEISSARPELRVKLFELSSRLHEDDNPVVMIVKLKTDREQ